MQHPAIRFNSASAFLYLIFHTTFNTPDLLVGWFLTLHKNPLVSMVLSVYLDKSIGSSGFTEGEGQRDYLQTTQGRISLQSP